MIAFPLEPRDSPGSLLSGRYQLRETIRSGKAFSVRAGYDLLRKEFVQVVVFSRGLRREFPLAVRQVREQVEQNLYNRHPLFLNVLFVAEQADRLFFVEERPRGESLQAVFQRRTEGQEPFSLQEALGIGWLLGRALGHLHGWAVHGFLNPDDVYLEPWPDGPLPCYPRVARIALRAALRQAGLAVDGLPEESAWYAAPEFSSQTRLQKEADIYGIGALLYSLLTLRPPTGCFVRPSRVGTHVPAELDGILLKAMDEDPADRFGHAGALLHALSALEEGEVLNWKKLEEAEGKLVVRARKGFRRGKVSPSPLPVASRFAPAEVRRPGLNRVSAPPGPRPSEQAVSILLRALLMALSLSLVILAVQDAFFQPRNGRPGPEDVQRWERLFRSHQVFSGPAQHGTGAVRGFSERGPFSGPGEGI